MMGLKGRIPVEPLDDERLTNIERRIVAGAADVVSAPRRPRFGLVLAVAATVVVAIGAGFAGWKLRGGGSTTTELVAADPVRVNTTGERSVLDIGDARIESDASTDFTVTRPGGGVLVTMQRGKVHLDVDKRAGRAPLVVAAGDTRVIVVGTRFSVDYGDGTNGVDVRVTEGVVKVERHQQEVRVAAGQAWTTKRGVIALAELPETPVTLATIDAPEDRDADQIEIDTDAPEILDDRKPAVPDAKMPAAGMRTSPRPTKPDVIVRPGPSAGSGGSVAVDLRKLVLAQPVLAPIPTTQHPTQATAEYLAIMREKKGVEHAHALYSLAWTQHMKLGRNADALRSIDAVARGFQGRTEYKAIYHGALWLRVRILCTKGVDDRCRQAAYTHMHEATGTPAATVAERLTLAPR